MLNFDIFFYRNTRSRITYNWLFFFFLVGSGQWVSQCPGTTLQKKINLFIFSGSPEQAESNSGFSEKIC